MMGRIIPSQSLVVVLPEDRLFLERLRNQINPRHLREEIYDAIDHIFSLPDTAPGVTENVFLTLTENSEKENDEMSDLAFNRTTINN